MFFLFLSFSYYKWQMTCKFSSRNKELFQCLLLVCKVLSKKQRKNKWKQRNEREKRKDWSSVKISRPQSMQPGPLRCAIEFQWVVSLLWLQWWGVMGSLLVSVPGCWAPVVFVSVFNKVTSQLSYGLGAPSPHEIAFSFRNKISKKKKSSLQKIMKGGGGHKNGTR